MTQNAVNEPFPFRQMIDLHAALNDAAKEYAPMPDEAMDHIGEAISVIRKAIIQAPVASEADVAHKFRFAAEVIEDESGILYDEPAAIFGALTDLARLRDTEWRTFAGKPCPWYGEYAR